MVKYYFAFQTFIVCLFLYVRISSAEGERESDRYDFEDSYLLPDEYIELKLLNPTSKHDIYKRDTSNTTTADKKLDIAANVSGKPDISMKLASSFANSSAGALHHHVGKNLGENGTGIRHTSTTYAPLLVNSVNTSLSGKTIINNKINKTRNVTNDSHDSSEYEDGDFTIGNPIDLDTEEGSKKLNKSLSEHNVTSSKTDSNLFYKTTILDDAKIVNFYWVDMKNRSDVKVNEVLSHSHRRAVTVKLSFNFPFYGHLIKNLTIATGGFLYTGDFTHSWLAATQYIAPLMANFDTSLSNNSFVKYFDNGTAFTVEWDRVSLQDKPEDGEFTFQVTLFNNGDIAFVYKYVPLFVDKIQELQHPVKVGLSDAYIMDQTVFLVRRKTIFEYDRVHFNKTHIKNNTMILLKALPTCLEATDCATCLSRNLNYECFWCPAMGKCSQGYDRHRQIWLAHGCNKTSFSNVSFCSSFPSNIDRTYVFDHHDISDQKSPKGMALAGKILVPSSQNEVGMSSILAIIFLIAMVSGLSFWVLYAYRNPHTTSGQILIRYRPSQWRWRRGEARYTAATIHM